MILISAIQETSVIYRDVLWENGKSLSIFVKPPVPSFPINPKKETWSKWEWQDVVASWNWEE
jgi:beta-galactosidase